MSNTISRRTFLKSTGLVLPMSAVLAACGHEETSQADRNTPVFFSHDEVEFVDAAVRRLIPNDELGPGAHEANVTGFIDLQLAGAYGRAERWYMQGPWPKGTKQQGYQTKLTPAGVYRDAIAATDKYCRNKYGKAFAALSDAQKDEVLHGLEKGDIKFSGVPSDTFFTLLWQNTQEGFFADPVYGGNRDFAGWKLIGFPGPRYNYVEEIEKYGQPYKEPCVSLVGRDPIHYREII